MGASSAAAVVAASMIGAGVYTTSGFTLGDLQSRWLVLLAWGIGGVIAICGALCYGALARRFTESGGEYVFLARAVHPAAGMMAGWVSLLAGFTGAMAFAAATFESYAREWQSGLVAGLPSHSIAIALVLAAALIHSLGLHRGTRVQNGVVMAKFVLITLFLLVAVAALPSWDALVGEGSIDAGEATGAGSEVVDWALILAMANALTWISLSYSGFNAAVYLTDEVEDPHRNVPRAMLWATAGVTALYLLLNAVFVMAPPVSEVAGQANVATLAAEAIGRQWTARGVAIGAWIGDLVRLAILTGLATSVLALMQTGPRVYQKMATDRLLPQFLIGRPGSPAGVGRGEPHAGIWLQALLAIVVICFATLRQQLDYLGFTLSVCAATCGALVLIFPADTDLRLRPVGHPWVPLIYVGGTLVIAALTAIRVPVQAVVGLMTLAIGIVVYVLSRWLWGSRSPEDW